MTEMTTCTKCAEFFERFQCNAPDECDCPRCQGLCECGSNWTMFTKRTNDPKLAWIERQLDIIGVPYRRNGESFHAPILEVSLFDLEKAETILSRRIGRYTVDDIRDDHPRWNYPTTKREEVKTRISASLKNRKGE